MALEESWGGEGTEVRSDVPEELLAGPPLQESVRPAAGSLLSLDPARVSWRCHRNLPPTRWFKATEAYPLPVLQARVPN